MKANGKKFIYAYVVSQTWICYGSDPTQFSTFILSWLMLRLGSKNYILIAQIKHINCAVKCVTPNSQGNLP